MEPEKPAQNSGHKVTLSKTVFTSERVKKFWEEIRKNPEKYKEFLEKRKSSSRFFGRRHTEEDIKKMSEALKGRRFSEEHKQKISLGLKRAWLDPFSHAEAIKVEVEKLKKQGYRCIPIGMYRKTVIPDIIAIKGEQIQIVAVEVETAYQRPAHKKYKKYNKTDAYDDVIWILGTNKVKIM